MKERVRQTTEIRNLIAVAILALLALNLRADVIKVNVNGGSNDVTTELNINNDTLTRSSEGLYPTSYSDVIKKVSPSVVSIISKKKAASVDSVKMAATVFIRLSNTLYLPTSKMITEQI